MQIAFSSSCGVKFFFLPVGALVGKLVEGAELGNFDGWVKVGNSKKMINIFFDELKTINVWNQMDGTTLELAWGSG